MKDHTYFTYILASERNGTFYVGVTNDLHWRVGEHKRSDVEGFTRRYGVDRLVWHEMHQDIEVAIQREKAIKRWRRLWKLELIEKDNPEWWDLWEDMT